VPSAVNPFLMFEGRAEEAMRFYAETFADAEIVSLEHHGEGEPGAGGVLRGVMRIAGLELVFFDSPVEHAFGFTPAISLFVECESGEEVDRLADGLGDGGSVLMPVDAYPFAARFGWVNDRFGVSWQLRAG
jgi:predicted 3-demethylubiquinone-9 3-methyltransferase (glyoxalase superfamily)